MLGKVQVGEFSSSSVSSSARSALRTLFTVSGVIVAYRRAASHRCGYWSLDTVTEDIDISWCSKSTIGASGTSRMRSPGS